MYFSSEYSDGSSRRKTLLSFAESFGISITPPEYRISLMSLFLVSCVGRTNPISVWKLTAQLEYYHQWPSHSHSRCLYTDSWKYHGMRDSSGHLYFGLYCHRKWHVLHWRKRAHTRLQHANNHVRDFGLPQFNCNGSDSGGNSDHGMNLSRLSDQSNGLGRWCQCATRIQEPFRIATILLSDHLASLLVWMLRHRHQSLPLQLHL